MFRLLANILIPLLIWIIKEDFVFIMVIISMAAVHYLSMFTVIII
jgi:hypothetical protein